MVSKDRIYDSVIPAAIHLSIALLSFVLGIIILLGQYPSFFSAVLTFALGFSYEYSIMIDNDVRKKIVYCKRIRIEFLFGLFSGLVIVIASIVMITLDNVATAYEPLAIVSTILSSVYLAIICIEVCYSAADFLSPDKSIPPIVK